MGSFDEALFEQKLLYLKDTHDSIANLSSWCLSNQEHHGKIVSTWLNVLKKVKTEHRLLLFYLANDVIQYSKRKSLPFADSFAPALQKATTMVRKNSVKNKILRLFKIWSERGIYDEAFLVDLSNLLSRVHKNVSDTDIQEFQPSVMYSRIRSCKELEDDTDVKLNTLNKKHISFTDIDKLRHYLKDREHGDELLVEFDAGMSTVKAYVKALEAEIKERHGLIDLLEIGEQYYEREFQEAKVVVNAYKCFATRVRGVKRKLEEQIETMPSPIPSPDINAPSPSPEPEPKDEVSVSVSASTHKQYEEYVPNNYFPPNRKHKGNDDETDLISPYSPESNFDEEPSDSTYREESDTSIKKDSEESPKVYVPPKLQKPSIADTTYSDSYNSNNTVVSISYTPTLTSDTFFPQLNKATSNNFHVGNQFQEPMSPEPVAPVESSYVQRNIDSHYMPINPEPPPYTPSNVNSTQEASTITPPVVPSGKQHMTLSALLQTLIPSENSSQNSETPRNQQQLNDIPHPPEYSPLTEEPEPIQDTPESPPMYEKANYPSIFDEQLLGQDTDMRFSDVDHRNLITLTEMSNSNSADDMDYRTKVIPKQNNQPYIQNQDNVENVDMEMSDDEEKLHEALKAKSTSRTSEILTIPLQSPQSNKYTFNNPSPPDKVLTGKSEDSEVKPVIPPEPVAPYVPFNNSPSTYPATFTNSSPYQPNKSANNSNNSTPANYNSGSNYSANTSMPPFKGYYVSPPPPPPVKVEVSTVKDYIIDKYPSPSTLQPPPPPPPPPPHPSQLWAPQSFPRLTPPPQFDNSHNFHQQPLFFHRPPPPPVPPSPQTAVNSRPYRADFRPFQRVATRFQRW